MVAEHGMAGAVDNVDTVQCIEGDQVSGPGRRATDGVACATALNLHTVV